MEAVHRNSQKSHVLIKEVNYGCGTDCYDLQTMELSSGFSNLEDVSSLVSQVKLMIEQMASFMQPVNFQSDIESQ